MSDQIMAYLERYELFKLRDLPEKADRALLGAYGALFLTFKRGCYLKNKNYRIVNRAFLKIIKKTFATEKLRSFKFFVRLFKETLREIMHPYY